MDFLSQRKWNREEIMAAFKVPKGEVGINEDINYATSKTQRKLFWENTLLPKMALFEFVLLNQLLRHIDGGRIWAEFDYSSISALQEDRKDLVECAHKLWPMGVPLNTANEYLGLGLPAVAGGDTGYLPFSLAPVGQDEPASEKTVPYPLLPINQGAAGAYPPPAVPLLPVSFDGLAYWKAYLTVHTPLEEMFRSKISRYFYGQRKRQLRRLEERLGKGLTKELSVEELLLNPDTENNLLKKLVWPLYLEIGETAGQALILELGADPGLFTLVDTPAMAPWRTSSSKWSASTRRSGSSSGTL